MKNLLRIDDLFDQLQDSRYIFRIDFRFGYHRMREHEIEVKYAKEKLGVEFLSDYDCEIRYHPGKANIVVIALSRKERVKPGRLRAIAMTIQSRVKRMILAAQSEAFKEKNKLAERLYSLDQQMESKEYGGCTLWTNYGIHC
ncbi:hypothetical protein Tco_0560604 [Tanacetum coccineum]